VIDLTWRYEDIWSKLSSKLMLLHSWSESIIWTMNHVARVELSILSTWSHDVEGPPSDSAHPGSNMIHNLENLKYSNTTIHKYPLSTSQLHRIFYLCVSMYVFNINIPWMTYMKFDSLLFFIFLHLFFLLPPFIYLFIYL
jgi:hypothetical protein